MCSSVRETWKFHVPFLSDKLGTSKEMSFLIQAILFFVPRSHDVKNGGEPAHPTHSPGQSSPHPGISQRVVNNKQAAPGFIGPQLPSHVMKVTLESGKRVPNLASLTELPHLLPEVTAALYYKTPQGRGIIQWLLRACVEDPSYCELPHSFRLEIWVLN